MKKQIKYCKWGLANSYETHIEINEKLRYNKPLRDIIVKHELGHKDSFDISHEFDISIWKKIIPLSIFIIKNPKTWIDFLPIQIKNKQLTLDINMIILYILIIIILLIKIKFL